MCVCQGKIRGPSCQLVMHNIWLLDEQIGSKLSTMLFSSFSLRHCSATMGNPRIDPSIFEGLYHQFPVKSGMVDCWVNLSPANRVKVMKLLLQGGCDKKLIPLLYSTNTSNQNKATCVVRRIQGIFVSQLMRQKHSTSLHQLQLKH